MATVFYRAPPVSWSVRSRPSWPTGSGWCCERRRAGRGASLGPGRTAAGLFLDSAFKLAPSAASCVTRSACTCARVHVPPPAARRRNFPGWLWVTTRCPAFYRIISCVSSHVGAVHGPKRAREGRENPAGGEKHLISCFSFLLLLPRQWLKALLISMSPPPNPPEAPPTEGAAQRRCEMLVR